ncbi:hypothetical protein TSAR_011516 [Trichomalopsis sarcophagae]|uniref:Uncharacterized protein n=1 Tax=Trichomalopsis sarcophagae TaxID=543379 RepID=A0A232ED63_9HYME|nr:hypothetical protein TSAR_011516 [Trichomalopsis sarcophagae]
MSPDLFDSQPVQGEKEPEINDDAMYNFEHNELNLQDNCGDNCCCLSNNCTRYNHMMAKLDTIIENQQKLQNDIKGITRFFLTVENAVHGIERCFHRIMHLLIDHLNMRFANNQ